MTRFFRLSLWAYRRLLILYPEDLRRDFGPEMLEAFANDLAVGRAVRVWRIALCEVIRIGLPGWLRNPAVAVPTLSATGTILAQSPLLMVSFRSGGATPLEALSAMAIEAAIVALISFVAVYPWKRSSLVTLRLR